jgi:hypothetical protein
MGIADNPNFSGISIPEQQKANYNNRPYLTVMIVCAYLLAILGTLMSGAWIGLALVMDAIFLCIHILVLTISK